MPVESPPATRLARPRWLDAKLVVGLLLVCGSVALGARVLQSADRYQPVYAAAHDLAAGTVLQTSDLVAVQVRFGAGVAAGYLAASQALPSGYVLTRAVGRDELLARAAVRPQAAGETRLVAVPVPAGHVPDGLARGDLVDVLVTAKGTDGSTGATTTVASAIPVDSVPAAGSGAIGAAVQDTVVTLRVPADLVVSLVNQVQSGAVALVLVPAGSAAAASPAAVAAPAGSTAAAGARP